jgi:hypothetical protein
MTEKPETETGYLRELGYGYLDLGTIRSVARISILRSAAFLLAA